MNSLKSRVGRSLAGVVRERLEGLEQRIALGWGLAALHRELVAEGYDHDFEGFRSALRRARHQARQRPVPVARAQAPAQQEAGAALPVASPDYFTRRSVFR